MTSERLTLTNRLLMGLTAFSIFFGAGNLIFPSHMGSLAGSAVGWAMAGFAVTAVILPTLAVSVVAKAGGIGELASRVHPAFAAVFPLVLYLAIGPCIGIPRTATTSFEIAIAPAICQAELLPYFEEAFITAFFALSGYLALHPEKIGDRLSRYTSPLLLIFIVGLFIVCVVSPLGSYGLVLPPYDVNAIGRGFLEGYQTMDLLAAMNFGLILAMNVRSHGITNSKAVVNETVRASIWSGIVLLLIYAALSVVGAQAGGAGLLRQNGAQTLTAVASAQFGTFGFVVMGVVFFVACLNTCVGLLSCCSDYFAKTFPVLGYRAWLAVFVVVSFAVSSVGLADILKYSIPFLMVIYPVSLTLILLGVFHRINRHFPSVYPLTVILTFVASLAGVLHDAGLPLGVVRGLPFYSLGLEWLLPAFIGWVAGFTWDSGKHESP